MENLTSIRFVPANQSEEKTYLLNWNFDPSPNIFPQKTVKKINYNTENNMVIIQTENEEHCFYHPYVIKTCKNLEDKAYRRWWILDDYEGEEVSKTKKTAKDFGIF